MRHTIKKEDNGDIHITINVSNNLTNSSNSSAENTHTNTAEIDSEPQEKGFFTRLFEGVAIGAATALAATFF